MNLYNLPTRGNEYALPDGRPFWLASMGSIMRTLFCLLVMDDVIRWVVRVNFASPSLLSRPFDEGRIHRGGIYAQLLLRYPTRCTGSSARIPFAVTSCRWRSARAEFGRAGEGVTEQAILKEAQWGYSARNIPGRYYRRSTFSERHCHKRTEASVTLRSVPESGGVYGKEYSQKVLLSCLVRDGELWVVLDDRM